MLFLYPETIHQQAVNFGGDRSVEYSEGHYDFYYSFCHFIYVLMCPFLFLAVFVAFFYLLDHFKIFRHSSLKAGAQGAFAAYKL